MKGKEEKITIKISDASGAISGLVVTPANVQAVLVLAHGAGAGMSHPFMSSLAGELGERSIATVRYNFPYMENKRGRPDPPAIAEKTVAMVVEDTRSRFPKTPLFAGGKSFGGRMTSQRLAKECPNFVKGIVFFGFPLHPLGAPGVERAAHLSKVKVPLLFLQGSRDKMAEPELLQKVCNGLPSARLFPLEGADHSFKLGKQNLIPVLADETARWIEENR